MMKHFIFSIFLLLFLNVNTSFGQILKEIDSYTILQKGIQFHDDKKYAQAITEFKKINKNDTNFVIAALELANSYVANKQDSLAVIACDQVLSMNTGYEPNALLHKANALDNMGKSDEAVKVYEEAIRRFPLNNSFYHELGVLKYNQKKYIEANELFKKSIKYNPYYAPSHLQMGNLAILQGKLVPAMLAWSYYLLIDNTSDRAKSVVIELEKMAQNEYDFSNAITIEQLSDQDDFSEIQALVKSKVALGSKYKSEIDLNYNLTKQLQLILEKITVDKSDKGFYMQYYAPLFQQIYKSDYFEPFAYYIVSGMNVDKVNSWIKKNNKDYVAFSKWFVDYTNEHNSTFEATLNGKTIPARHWYSNANKILAIGNVDAAGNSIGYWNYYYSNGIIKSEGAYNNQNKRTGAWKFYFATGIIKSLENYEDGQALGTGQDFFENGSPKLNKVYKNGLLEGVQTSYFPTGLKYTTYDYKAGKENGKETQNYPNGKLKYSISVVNEKYEGSLTQYYDNGHVKEKSTFKNGNRDGKYEDFYNYPENQLMSTGLYANGVPVGEWKNYYANGKMEETGKYNKNGEKDGVWKTYFDNDTLSSIEVFSNGKLDGLNKNFDDNGFLTEEYTYKNDILQEYKAYNNSGKIIFQNKKDGKKNYDLLLYHSNGNKRKEGKIVNGKLDDEWRFYDLDGFMTDKTVYIDGKKQGKSVSYYENGKIKNESNFVDNETDGYYKEYYKNGNIKREGPYVSDKQLGVWNEYYFDGKLKTINYFKNDEIDGWQEYYAVNGKLDAEEFYELGYLKRRINYDSTGKVIDENVFDKGTGELLLKYPNGKVCQKSTFKNDLKQGLSTSYFGNGKESIVQNYVDGKLQGESKLYYPSGKIEWINNFENGNRNGKQTHYDEDGNIEAENNYLYGKLSGKAITYYPNKQIKYSNNYKGGELDGNRQIYDENGELAIERYYHNGYILSYTYYDKTGKLVPSIPVKNETGTIKAFYKNGSPSIEYTLTKGVLTGKRTEYYFNGKVKTDEDYEFGNQVGLSKAYYSSGKIQAEENYANDDKNGKCTYYYENGKVKSEGYYLNGEQHGTFNYYDNTGKLLKSYVYYNGYLIDEKK